MSNWVELVRSGIQGSAWSRPRRTVPGPAACVSQPRRLPADIVKATDTKAAQVAALVAARCPAGWGFSSKNCLCERAGGVER